MVPVFLTHSADLHSKKWFPLEKFIFFLMSVLRVEHLGYFLFLFPSLK